MGLPACARASLGQCIRPRARRVARRARCMALSHTTGESGSGPSASDRALTADRGAQMCSACQGGSILLPRYRHYITTATSGNSTSNPECAFASAVTPRACSRHRGAAPPGLAHDMLHGTVHSSPRAGLSLTRARGKRVPAAPWHFP